MNTNGMKLINAMGLMAFASITKIPKIVRRDPSDKDVSKLTPQGEKVILRFSSGEDPTAPFPTGLIKGN